jgi:3-dehydroquinate synthase
MKSAISIVNALSEIISILKEYRKTSSKMFFVMDENTAETCFSLIKNQLDFEYLSFVLKPGEQTKSCSELLYLLEKLENYKADRDALIVNIGGGVITDLGGFAASVYKRGIAYINIPTSLIGQIDAAIGGKTGVNAFGIKNNIGSFYEAKKTIIYEGFLNTLPEELMFFSYAEVLKYALLSERSFFEEVTKNTVKDYSINSSHKKKSITKKQELCKKDFYDNNERKSLNLGHSFAHALEAYCVQENLKMHHGLAVGLGLMLSLYFSKKFLAFPKKDYDKAMFFLSDYLHYFPKQMEVLRLVELMKHDKKSKKGEFNFILLQKIGKVSIDYKISQKDLEYAIEKIYPC